MPQSGQDHDALVLPDVYIIGTQKSGTTSLYDWIAQHPRVYGNPSAKDVPFFAMDDVYSKGLQHLVNLFRFAPPDSLVLGGEVSAIFFPFAIERLHAVIPNAKLIVAIRNPVDRAYSAWQFAVERGLEDRTFEQSVADEILGITYETNIVNLAYKDYLARGKYAEQLECLSKHFPAEQVHVIFFEELRADPEKVMNGVWKYFGVDNFKPEFDVKNVTQGGARFKWIQRLLYIPRNRTDIFARFVRALLPYGARFIVRSFLEQINRVPNAKRNAMTPEIRQTLVEYFMEDMGRLPSLIGVDAEKLTKLGWGK